VEESPPSYNKKEFKRGATMLNNINKRKRVENARMSTTNIHFEFI